MRRFRKRYKGSYSYKDSYTCGGTAIIWDTYKSNNTKFENENSYCVLETQHTKIAVIGESYRIPFIQCKTQTEKPNKNTMLSFGFLSLEISR